MSFTKSNIGLLLEISKCAGIKKTSQKLLINSREFVFWSIINNEDMIRDTYMR